MRALSRPARSAGFLPIYIYSYISTARWHGRVYRHHCVIWGRSQPTTRQVSTERTAWQAGHFRQLCNIPFVPNLPRLPAGLWCNFTRKSVGSAIHIHLSDWNRFLFYSIAIYSRAFWKKLVPVKVDVMYDVMRVTFFDCVREGHSSKHWTTTQPNRR